MLIEFGVSNFRSIKDEIRLSMMEAGGTKEEHRNVIDSQIKGIGKLLSSAVIYGANASGKSNIIHSLHRMISFVRNSTDINSQLPYEPFLLDSNSKNEDTSFDVRFIIDGCPYHYGFSVNNECVTYEFLDAYPNGKKQSWFERDKNNYSYSAHFKGEKKSLESKTREDSLFISTAATFDNEQISLIWDWLNTSITISNDINFAGVAAFYKNNKEIQKRAKDFIHQADLGIDGFAIEEAEFNTANLPAQIRGLIQLNDSENIVKGSRIVTFHKNYDTGETVEFDLKQHESDGTKAIFSLAGLWLETLDNGSVIFYDELEKHLHPNLLEYLIKAFNNPEINKNNAQLVLTTHNTHLLSMDNLRRDQIWFVDKNQEGCSRLYSLANIKVRKDSKFEKQYLAGNFGAVPYLGEFNV